MNNTKKKDSEGPFFIHIDADAFFASVEQCLHKELKGKPTVTGRGASIVIAMSYEAKALGIERGIPTHMIHEEFPDVQMVDSDYQMYKIFSDRMQDIVNKHLSNAKRTSIDECQGQLSTDIKSTNEAYEAMNLLKSELELKLGCTFSIGIARTPILAKIASAMEKPSGITGIYSQQKQQELKRLSVSKVPGFGRKFTPQLRNMGIGTIGQFIDRYESISRNFSSNVRDIYLGLTEIRTQTRAEKPIQSMNRARSFKVSNDSSALLGQLTVNFEFLMHKLRHEKLKTKTIYLTVRNQQRVSSTQRSSLPGPCDDHNTIMKEVLKLLNKVTLTGEAYRYISLTFSGLSPNGLEQLDLFEEHLKQKEDMALRETVDTVNKRFAGNYLSLATTLNQPKSLGSHINAKKTNITMRNKLLPQENKWRRLKYPFLGSVH